MNRTTRLVASVLLLLPSLALAACGPAGTAPTPEPTRPVATPQAAPPSPPVPKVAASPSPSPSPMPGAPTPGAIVLPSPSPSPAAQGPSRDPSSTAAAALDASLSPRTALEVGTLGVGPTRSSP